MIIDSFYITNKCFGSFLATSLGQLEAVSKIPDNFVRIRHANDSMIGVCSHLGKTVSVYCLSELLGKSGSDQSVSESMLLIIKSKVGLKGFVVSSVDFLQWAVTTKLPNNSRNFTTGESFVSEMIRVSKDGIDASASVVDLSELTHRSQNTDAPTVNTGSRIPENSLN